MAKKKWKFTDLSDDVEVEEEKSSISFEDNIKSIKKDQELLNNILNENKEVKKQQSENQQALNNKKETIDVSNKIIVNDYEKALEKKNNNKTKNIEEIPTSQEKEITQGVITNNQQDSINRFNSKYDIDIDYDSDIPIKQQIQEHQKKQKLYTFNETVQMKRLPEEEQNIKEFNNEKIQQFIKTKEKLDVKTNIYLKPNLVNKITTLCKQTGESRSSIINKLIEHALKEIENN